ncbi:hypothetical protein XELAEV_18013466mg [Xenopus laevis]|uniref:Uncharacterized protein n=1 Tax=Xenopus laevis TaxID=8355 RepID=A0A974HZD1_XENLA|nr:hypothetical protein XELAEV_18013466mg [Xenopus laevis]
MIVRSALPKTTKAGTFPCNSNRCETCKYILCKLLFRIHKKSTPLWTTIRGIFIGETGQKFRTRMNHHRHTINIKSCDTPVGQHFCSQNHSLNSKREL